MTADEPADTAHSRAKVVIRLRGLPFSCVDDDVRSFFGDFEVIEIYFCRRDGRPTGEAYVVLDPSVDAQACLSQLDKKHIGNRYIELFGASSGDLRAVKKMLEDRSLQGYVVRLRGLPYSASDADVREFMDGVQLSPAPDCIVFAHGPDGRPTGEAYVDLADEQALGLAMTRHKEVMGSRYIEVFNSSKMDKVQAQKQLEALSGGGGGGGSSSSRGDGGRRWMQPPAPHSSTGHGPRGLPMPAGMMQQTPYTRPVPAAAFRPVMVQHYQHAAAAAADGRAAGPLASGMGAAAWSPVSGPMASPGSLAGQMPGPRALAGQGYAAGVLHIMQPGLLHQPLHQQQQQQQQHLPPQITSTAGLPAVAAACAGVSAAALQMGQVLPMPGLQGMVSSGPASGYLPQPQQQQQQQQGMVSSGPACGYLPLPQQQQQPSAGPLLLGQGVQPLAASMGCPSWSQGYEMLPQEQLQYGVAHPMMALPSMALPTTAPAAAGLTMEHGPLINVAGGHPSWPPQAQPGWQ